MANILTYIELNAENEATPESLSALNQGRNLASELGATLYALLPCAATPSYDDEDIIAVLSRYGADKVILITDPQLVHPALFATHGEALLAACRQFPPRVVLFPASAESQDLAPRLAIGIRARYVPDATLEPEQFTTYRQVFRRRYEVSEPLFPNDNPLLLTLRDGPPPKVIGDDEAEVVVVHAPTEKKPPAIRVHRGPMEVDGVGGPTIGGGAGLGDNGTFELLERLAQAMGGVPAASSSACAEGLAKSELQVGLDAAPVVTDLYLAFGVSGSERHIAALAPNTDVVAINNDPDAPIFHIARHGLVADAAEVLRELVAQLERGSK